MESELLVTSAGRLRFWLGRADAYSVNAGFTSESGQKRGSLPPSNALSAWCSIWSLDVETTRGRAECHSRGIALLGEGVKVRQTIEGEFLGNYEAETALEHFEGVERTLACFTYLQSIQITPMMRHVGIKSWSALDVLHRLMLSTASSFGPTPGAVAELLRRTRGLIRDVSTSELLSSADRRDLLDRLHGLVQALERVAVSGPSAAEAAVDGTMGLMMRLYLRGVDVSRHPLTRATLGLIAAVALILGMGADYAQIAGSPLGRLLGLPEK